MAHCIPAIGFENLTSRADRPRCAVQDHRGCYSQVPESSSLADGWRNAIEPSGAKQSLQDCPRSSGTSFQSPASLWTHVIDQSEHITKRQCPHSRCSKTLENASETCRRQSRREKERYEYRDQLPLCPRRIPIENDHAPSRRFDLFSTIYLGVGEDS